MCQSQNAHRTMGMARKKGIVCQSSKRYNRGIPVFEENNMKAKRFPSMVKKMFDEGEVSMVYPVTKDRYSLTANCPGESEYAEIARYDKSGHSLKRVVFKCAVCGMEFEVPQDKIMVI